MTTETDDLVKRLRDLAMDAATRKDHDTGGKIWFAADTIERLQREHCKDCCCAQSWRALGVTEYTGMSIPEHIERLRRDLRECVELVAYFVHLAEGESLPMTFGNALNKARALLSRLKETL